jgi:hypothetical protein
MRWPWPKRHVDEVSRGTVAREKATADLAQAQAKWPEVTRVAQSLRELRERNHFGDQVRLIFQGGENRGTHHR